MFFILPIGVDYTARRYPVVTFSLIGANVLVFLAALAYAMGGGSLNEDGTWWYTNLWLSPASSPWYCHITAIFAHAGFFHLLGNMIYLFLFGSPVEDMMGRWQFLLFYLLGGLASNFTHIAFTPGHFASEIRLVGASGAISACMGAFAFLMFKSRIEFKWALWIIVRLYNGEFQLPTWLVMSFWFLKDLGSAVLSYGNPGSGVAFGAHVGGFVAGLLMIIFVKWLWQFRIMRRADVEEEDGAVAGIPASQTPIYVSENGAELGPFTVAQVLEMLRLGSVSRDAFYWREGLPEWRSVSEIYSEFHRPRHFNR